MDPRRSAVGGAVGDNTFLEAISRQSQVDSHSAGALNARP